MLISQSRRSAIARVSASILRSEAIARNLKPVFVAPLSPLVSLEPSLAPALEEFQQFPRFFKTIHNRQRRQNLPLDAAYFYLRHVELKLQKADLFKVCNSIKAVDMVLGQNLSDNSSFGSFSQGAWALIKERLFQILLTNFSGRYIVYSLTAKTPLTKTLAWSDDCFVDFYPEKTSRPDEFYSQSLNRLSDCDRESLRKKFVMAKLQVAPRDFNSEAQAPTYKSTSALLCAYEICDREIELAKSNAEMVRKILQNRLKNSADRQRRKEIRRQLVKLEALWGREGHY